VSQRIRHSFGSFFARLLLGLLAVSVPVMIVLAVVLTRSAAGTLEESVGESFRLTADESSAQITKWLQERDSDVKILATLMTEPALGADASQDLKHFSDVYGAYAGIQVLDARGRILAGSHSTTRAILPPRSSVRERALRSAEMRTALRVDDAVRVLVSRQFTAAGGARRIVVADLKRAAIATFLAEADNGVAFTTLVVDAEKRVVAREGSELTAEQVASEGVGAVFTEHSARRALAGQSGWLRLDGWVAGYSPVKSLGWAVVTRQHDYIALADVTSQRRLAIVIVIAGIALTALFALLFARRVTRPITALAATSRHVTAGDLKARVTPAGPRELRDLAESFNGMVQGLDTLAGKVRTASAEISSSATQLAASSEELSATATEQSAAAVETSATMEELSRTSTSIAEGATAVAHQSAETRAVIAQADEDITASSVRTLALSDQVAQIGGILALINELADQTNLLALNAAIEAARAGEAGAGFAVVADEIRSLAERSKGSAKEIATIIQGTQAETNATVMAMEKGSAQLRRGVDLMDDVTEAISQVQHTTQQQEAAGVEVVATMESLTEGSRQTSSTIDEVAAAVGNLAALAADLATTAARSAGQQSTVDPMSEAPFTFGLTEPEATINGHAPLVTAGER
jgi:methyl-accepting chemotaxis protein